MPELFTLMTLLRHLVKSIIAITLLSNPLLAADKLITEYDDSPFSFQQDKVCYGKVCLESNKDKKMPDMFTKPDRLSQRERTDTWSTFDFDHSGNGISLNIGF